MLYNFGSYNTVKAIEKAIKLNIKATRVSMSVNNVIIAESEKGVYAFMKSRLNMSQSFAVNTKEGIWFVDKIILNYK